MCQRQNGDSGLQILDLKYHDLGYVSFHSCLAAQRCAKTTISFQLNRVSEKWVFFHRPLFVCGLWQMRCVTILGFSLFHLLCAILQISQQYRGNSLLVLLSWMLLSLLLLSLFGSGRPHLGQLPRDLLLEAWIYSQVLFHLPRLPFMIVYVMTLLVFCFDSWLPLPASSQLVKYLLSWSEPPPHPTIYLPKMNPPKIYKIPSHLFWTSSNIYSHNI